MATRPDRMMLDEGSIFSPQKTTQQTAAKGQPMADVLRGGLTQPAATTLGAGFDIPTNETAPVSVAPVSKKVISQYTDPATGDVYALYDDGSTQLLVRGTIQQSVLQKSREDAAAKAQQGQSAYDSLYNDFAAAGLGALVEPLKNLIISGASKAELTMALRKTPEYQKRFPANTARIANGYAAIDEAAYILKENAYQQKMQQYGLPDTYWRKNGIGTNDAFTQLLANDVPVTELEDRLLAGKQVMNASAPMIQAIKDWYPDITDGEILAYVLNPKNAIKDIQRKVSLGALGGEAIARGLSTSQKRAEELYNYGVTAEKYRSVAPFISEASIRGSQLGSFYQTPYEQSMAEAEALGLAGATEAEKARKKITGLEKASFSGSSGVSQNAITRDRAAGLI